MAMKSARCNLCRSEFLVWARICWAGCFICGAGYFYWCAGLCKAYACSAHDCGKDASGVFMRRHSACRAARLCETGLGGARGNPHQGTDAGRRLPFDCGHLQSALCAESEDDGGQEFRGGDGQETPVRHSGVAQEDQSTQSLGRFHAIGCGGWI